MLLCKGYDIERSRSYVKIKGVIRILDLKKIDLDIKIVILKGIIRILDLKIVILSALVQTLYIVTGSCSQNGRQNDTFTYV